MSRIEVLAHMTIRHGKLEEFKRHAAKIIQHVKENDTKTLRYDWFISDDQTRCEVLEAYESSEGLIEHRTHIGPMLHKLFTDYADGHAVTIYGDPSDELVQMAKAQTGVDIQWFSFLGGLSSGGRLVSREVSEG